MTFVQTLNSTTYRTISILLLIPAILFISGVLPCSAQEKKGKPDKSSKKTYKFQKKPISISRNITIRLLEKYNHNQPEQRCIGESPLTGTLSPSFDAPNIQYESLFGTDLSATRSPEDGEITVRFDVAGEEGVLFAARDSVIISFAYPHNTNFRSRYQNRGDLIRFFLTALTFPENATDNPSQIRPIARDLADFVESRINTAYSKKENRSFNAEQSEVTIVDRSTLQTILNTAKNGHKSDVKSHLQQNELSPDVSDIRGTTALMVASKHGKRETARMLLQKGADPNVSDDRGRMALFLAATNNHTDIISTLLSSNARPNVRDEEDRTALMKAAEKGHLNAVKILVKNKADVNILSEEHKSALSKASKRGHKQIVEFLLENGADLSGKHGLALYEAATQGLGEIVNILLEAGAETEVTNRVGRTPLMVAVKKGHTEIVNSLLDHGANPNHVDKRGYCALSKTKKREIAKALIDAGANPNINARYSPLPEAAEQNRMDIVKLLLKHGAKPDVPKEDGHQSALREAAKQGNKKIVKILLQHDAKIFLPGKKGTSSQILKATREKYKSRKKTVKRYLKQMGVDRIEDLPEQYRRKLNKKLKLDRFKNIIKLLKKHREKRIKTFVEQNFPDPKKKTAKSIRHQIKRLGDKKITTREKAMKKLRTWGKKSLPILKKNRNHDNPEVRKRIREVIRKITIDHLRAQ